jgi:hypothetical protein
MMKYAPCLVVIAMTVAGCNPLSPPSAEADFKSKLAAGIQTETDLYDQFQMEDESLRYISGNSYSCGYPSSTRIQKAISKTAKQVAAEYQSPDIEKNLKFLDGYAKAMNAIATDDKKLLAALKFVTSAAGDFAAAKAAATAINGAVGALNPYIEDAVLIETAKHYKSTLDAAIGQLRNPSRMLL